MTSIKGKAQQHLSGTEVIEPLLNSRMEVLMKSHRLLADNFSFIRKENRRHFQLSTGEVYHTVFGKIDESLNIISLSNSFDHFSFVRTQHFHFVLAWLHVVPYCLKRSRVRAGDPPCFED